MTGTLLLQDKLNVAWQPRPFSGKVYKAALPQGLTCAEIVAQVPDLDHMHFLAAGKLCVNGEIIPREMWAYVRPKSREDIVVTLHMPLYGGGGGGGGKDTLRIVAAIALVVVTAVLTPFLTPIVGAFAATLITAAVSVGGALLLGAFVKPPAAAIEEQTTEEETGAVAGLHGNVLKRGAPIPRVVGTHRVFPSFLTQPLIDLDGYDEVAEAIYGLAGPHRMRDIKFGDVLADLIDPDQLSYQFYELGDEDNGVDGDVQIMLHLNGEQDSVTFTDSSFSERTYTATGAVFIDKRAGYLGLSAAYFGGSGSFLSTTSVPDFAPGEGEFQIDFWFEYDSVAGEQARLCGQTDAGLTAAGSAFMIEKTSGDVIRAQVSNGTTFTLITTTSIVNQGRHHYCLIRVGDVLRAFIDGIQQGGDIAFTGTIPGSSAPFCIGARSTAGTLSWTGWIDEFSYTVGKTWVTEDFDLRQTEYRPTEPTLITRYGKTGQPNITLARHRLLDDSATQGTRDKVSNQTTPQRSTPQAQSVVVRGPGLEEIWVTLGFQGLFYRDNDSDEDWFNAIPFRVRVRALGSTEWFNMPEIHVHDRRTTPFSRMVVFRWDSTSELSAGISLTEPALRKGWRAAYYTVPVQTVTPAGIGGWQADAHFFGSGDTYLTQENFATSGLRNIRMTTERVEFFLDGLVDKGPLEIEVRRGQIYVADQFVYSTYNYDSSPPADALSSGIYDFFGWATLASVGEVILLKASNASDEVTISRTSAVWNQPAVAKKGVFSTVYVRATGRTLEALSVLGSGLVADWDGESWTGLHATSNPAPHYRDVLVGDLNDNRIPESIVNDEVLLEWRQRCFDLDFQCNAIFAGEGVDRVLEVIAACGYARPRQSELWDIAQDRDFRSISPVQMFTPRNMNKFRWEKAFIRHRPDGLRVRYNEESDSYVEHTIVVPRLGIASADAGRLEEIRYDGITSLEQAVFRAVYDQQQVIDRFTFYYGEVDAEMLVCRKGDLVLVQHDTLEQFAGFSRVFEVERSGDTVSVIRLDGSVSPVDSFFLTTPSFFMEPTDFFSDNVGVGVRLKDGTFIAFEAAVEDDGFTLVPASEVTIAADQLERECLVTTGRLLRENRRMLVFDIRPRANLTAELAFIDEAPQLWQFPEPEEVEEAFMRNKVINGDMRLDQRGLGAVHTLTDQVPQYTLDRWSAFNGDSVGSTVRFNIQQLSSDPPDNFSHYMRATVTNALTPLPTGDRYAFYMTFVDSDLAELNWERSTGRQTSLSFVIRSSVAGTYSGRLFGVQSGATYVFTYTIPVVDTWIRRIITIPAPPTDPLFFNGEIGVEQEAFRIEWSLGLGEGFKTASVNEWLESIGATTRGATGDTDLVSTTGATLDITGVQFEVGGATQFEWLPLSIQQEQAYRYFQAFRQPLGTGVSAHLGNGFAASTTLARIGMHLPVPLRKVPPIITVSDGTHFKLAHQATSTVTTAISVGSPDESNPHAVEFFATVAAGLTAGDGVILQTDDVDAELFIDAEIP